jgi:hypothetical protein
MAENSENNRMMDGCNCVNCRLGRIEEQLDHIKDVLEASQSKNSKR